MKEESQWGLSLVERISFGAIMIGIIVGIFIVIILQLNPLKDFQDNCRAYGGNYWETQNVSCARGYDFCFAHCDVDGGTIEVDDNFCAKDCEFKNKEANGVVCMC